jgi:hypothetical protein
MEYPMALAENLEQRRDLPGGVGERFRGYGVVGLPFASGHTLAFRRMTSSSVGPPFTSIWHRGPEGRWTFYVDQDPEWSCPRFFGAAIDRVVTGAIELTWEGPLEVSLRVPDARFEWAVRLSADLRTRAITAVGLMLPGPVLSSEGVLSAMGEVGGQILGLGALALGGSTPNGQTYQASPRRVWRVAASAAVVDGVDLGPLGPLPNQVRLGDFWIPNRGIFAVGDGRFEVLDPSRHSRATTRRTRRYLPTRAVG